MKISGSRNNRIAIDFDGVLAQYMPGMASNDICGMPIEHAKEAVQALKDVFGYRIIIWTSRPITDNLKRWFKVNNVPYDEILPKPDCDLFIDDRAITFNGIWIKTLSQIEQFSEWWRNGNDNNS